MTLYLLDTNIISELIKNPRGKAAQRTAEVGEDKVCTSIIVAAELRYGCAKSGSKRLIKAVEALLGELTVLPFDVPADTDMEAFGPSWRRLELPSAATIC